MTDEIAKLQKRQREIEKLIATACGNMHASLHKEFQDNQKKLGKLMLERDKNERPEIYAEALAAAEEQEPVAWRVRVGDSKKWGYCETESDADFYGQQWGRHYEKQALYTRPPPPSGEAVEARRLALDYQERVKNVHGPLFDGDPTDVPERRDRFFEEATETVQAFGMTEEDAIALVRYTFSRPVGEPKLEVGSAALTLTSLCVEAGLDIMECAEADLAKLQRPETIARIRAKRATRHGRGPLPGFSPAPPRALTQKDKADE